MLQVLHEHEPVHSDLLRDSHTFRENHDVPGVGLGDHLVSYFDLCEEIAHSFIIDFLTPQVLVASERVAFSETPYILDLIVPAYDLMPCF